MAILPFHKQKMSTNGIKPTLTQEELAELLKKPKFGSLDLIVNVI